LNGRFYYQLETTLDLGESEDALLPLRQRVVYADQVKHGTSGARNRFSIKEIRICG
jgi:hypothetical protein